ncbi:transporter substrate-binding domain-containing protein [Agarivorans gilvus]|uniref:Solute-binding protein family 3/N-terminal domain-containing protein n=1 Tax=Agarivorans gilvus TaxID=680279 RepID=A0ABQ1HW72_9ALTE|nr:transporter substrate-binding domain-containing protein [Agarivorans gilvus]GGA94547.1 hypothetical protein GCM10007414_04080 [Agarivorans gilvus]
MKNKFWLISILICYWALIHEAVAQENEQFPVLAIEYPPFTTEEHPDGGLLMAELTAKTAPYALLPKPIFMPLVRVQRTLQEGDWCASFAPPLGFENYPSVATSLERLTFHLYRVKQKAPFQWQTFSELKGREVALIRSMEGTIVTQELLQSGIRPIYVNSLAQALKMAAKMRVDYALADEYSYQYYQQQGVLGGRFLEASEQTIYEFESRLWLNPECSYSSQIQAIFSSAAP